MDEFRSHFRMSRASMEGLRRETAATGRVPQRNTFGRAPITLQQEGLAFVCFLSNSEVICAVSDRFHITVSSLDRVIHRVSNSYVRVLETIPELERNNSSMTTGTNSPLLVKLAMLLIANALGQKPRGLKLERNRTPVCTGNFPLGRTKKTFTIYIPTRISGNLW